MNLSTGIFSDGKQLKDDKNWYATILLSFDELNSVYSIEDVTNQILNLPDDNFFKRTYESGRYLDRNIISEILHVGNNFSYYFAEGRRKRKRVLGSFWKIMHLVEFSLFTQTIFEQYKKFITNDTLKMKRLRFDKSQKFRIENIFGHDFYQVDILSHVNILDKFCSDLTPLYIGMYKYISKYNGTKKQETN
jgi:hypothetical protein